MITNAILPQTTGAASFKRVLGGSLNNVPRTAYIAWGRCGVVRQKDVVQVRDGVGPEGQQKHVAPIAPPSDRSGIITVIASAARRAMPRSQGGLR